MLIPIRKRNIETLVDEIGNIQVAIKERENILKKRKQELLEDLKELDLKKVESRRYQATYVERNTVSTNWQAVVDAMNIPAKVVEAYSRTRHIEYLSVKRRGDVK